MPETSVKRPICTPGMWTRNRSSPTGSGAPQPPLPLPLAVAGLVVGSAMLVLLAPSSEDVAGQVAHGLALEQQFAAQAPDDVLVDLVHVGAGAGGRWRRSARCPRRRRGFGDGLRSRRGLSRRERFASDGAGARGRRELHR